MIIQRVIKGVAGIEHKGVEQVLNRGIICRWWEEVDPLPSHEIPERLTERNLFWHQNRYEVPDPLENGRPFYERTPFISTTAGSVERDVVAKTNILTPAWIEALRFATNFWQNDGCLFYCYLFTLGKRSIPNEFFAEELRELHIYTGFSPFHPEGEITAKIRIPPSQIEKAECWVLTQLRDDLTSGRWPQPAEVLVNDLYLPPDKIHNIREVLT